MASTNKTANLSLNSWVGTDKPKMADFNQDNSVIDNILGGHVASQTLHLTESEKSRISEPLAKMVLPGNGNASRQISLGCAPTFAAVFKNNAPPVEYVDGTLKINFAIGYAAIGATKGLSVTSTGVTVEQGAQSDSGVLVNLNESGGMYTVVAFK